MSYASTKKREPFRFGLGWTIAIAALGFWYAGAFEPAEGAFTNIRARLLDRPPSGQTVIVEIDAKSIAEMQTWPWSRLNHAELIQALHRGGAEIIAFDIDFSAYSEPAADRALAKALTDAAPVILPIFQQQQSYQAKDAANLVSRPAPIFASAWIGGVNIFPGHDGLVRDYPAATYIAGKIQPSIATLLAENDSYGDQSFQPDWSIDAYRIPRLSYIDVLRNRVPASAVAGKRILVGATAIELGDRYATPRYGLTPGVVIQAIATESLLQDRAIQRSGPAPTIAAIVLVAFLLGAARYRTVFSYFSVAAPVVTVLAAGPLVAQWLWPISIDSAAALATACVCIAVRSGLELRRRSRLRALFDVESGLPNRLMLEKALLEDEQGSAVIIAASVDRFEIIRDTIGVSAAGEMILGTAERIRPMISGEIFRVAPDTIAWLEPEFDQDVFTARAKEFSALLRQPVASTQGAIDVTLRIGIDAEQTGKDPKDRIDNALVAIGEARASGALFESFKGADLDLRRRLSMMSDLRQGMEDGQVELFYQPKLSLHDNRISDAEALVRWNHPRDGQISPDDFIPLAEETGVIRELTNFALRRAMRDCVCWRAEGKTIRIAVNVSANDIAAPDFAALVEGMLRELGVAPDCLTLEVTESAIIRSPTTAISVLSDLRSQGIRLSIDDYGTGQSSLSYLKQLPIHELKIDRSFVTNI